MNPYYTRLRLVSDCSDCSYREMCGFHEDIYQKLLDYAGLEGKA